MPQTQNDTAFCLEVKVFVYQQSQCTTNFCYILEILEPLSIEQHLLLKYPCHYQFTNLDTREVSPHRLLVAVRRPKSVVPTWKQLEAAHNCPCLEVRILRAADLLLHLVLDNVQRLFALVDHVKGLNVFK